MTLTPYTLTYTGTATAGGYTWENQYTWSALEGPVGIYQILRHPDGAVFHADDAARDLPLTYPFAPPPFTLWDYDNPDTISCQTTLTAP
jgi:hypothetical protein